MALKIKTEEEYQALLARIAKRKAGGNAEGPSATKLVHGAGKSKKVTSKVSAAEAGAEWIETIAAGPKKKRRGVEETPILTSLRDCSIEAEASPRHVTLLFTGARLFTLNEIYAILQYRKYIVFAYKRQWHALVQRGLRLLGANKPHFSGPCKVTLFRQGAKPVDRDSVMVMFKYIIDALKDDEKKGIAGIFPDDNPDVVFDDEKIQTHGEPMVGIRVDLILPAPSIPTKGAADLFNTPPASVRARAAQRPAQEAPQAAPTERPLIENKKGITKNATRPATKTASKSRKKH